MTVRVDTRGWDAKLARFRGALPAARANAARAMVRQIAGHVIDKAPRDTGRYVAGWAEAANAAGVGPFAVPRIKPSAFAQRFRHQLDLQLQALKRKRGGYARGSPKLEAAIASAEKQIAEFTDTSIVVLGRSGAKTLKGKLTTVRSKIYGGTGFAADLRDRTVIVLRNREPHARIVESRSRLIRSAAAQLRGGGLQRVGRQFVKELQAKVGKQ